MFCANCGKKIDDDSKFCPYCGSSISVDMNTPSTDSNIVVTSKRSNKNVIIGVAACLVAVLAIIGVVKIFTGGSNKEVAEQEIEKPVAEAEDTVAEVDVENVAKNSEDAITLDEDIDAELEENDTEVEESEPVKVSFDWKQIYHDYFNTPSDLLATYATCFNMADINSDGVPEIILEEVTEDKERYQSYLFYINKDGAVDNITIPYCPNYVQYLNGTVHIVIQNHAIYDDPDFKYYEDPYISPDDIELIYNYNNETGSYDLIFEGGFSSVTYQGHWISGERVLANEYDEELNKYWDRTSSAGFISMSDGTYVGGLGAWFNDKKLNIDDINQAIEQWTN